jgi:PKD repeat protein
MKHKLCAGILALGLLTVAAAETKTIDLKAAVDAYRAQQEGVDSVILLLKEEATTGKKGAMPSFAGIGSLEKVLKQPSNSKKSLSSQASGLRKRMERLYTAPVQGGNMEAALKELNASPLVERAEPNWRVEAYSVNPPTDPLYAQMFPMNNTGQGIPIMAPPYYFLLGTTNGTPDADMDWQEAFTNQTPGQLFPTNEVIVAVIDTGVDYLHEDIDDNMWVNTAELNGTPDVDDDGNGYVDDIHGYDFYYDDGDPMDLADEGGTHGTHVAGTIAAEVNNFYGVVGVNPYCKIMALKFLGEGGGYTDDAIAAIIYATDNGAQIMNNSWGGGAWNESLQDAITYAVTNGVVLVAASGNSNTRTPHYPAAYRGVISVNSMDWNDDRAYYSNYGWFTDVSAHGSDILSLACSTWDNPWLTVQTNFSVIHGTSMACPQVAGALSLLIAKYPGLHPYMYEFVLEATCDTDMLDSVENRKYEGELGAGRINVNRMLNEDIDCGFLRLQWAGDTELAVPGSSYGVEIELGVWDKNYTDVTLTATNLTESISLNTGSVYLGAMDAFSTTNLATNLFVATIANEAIDETQIIEFTLLGDGKELAVATVRLGFISDDATHLVVSDFDGDGSNDIVTAYNDYLLRFNEQGYLQWAAQATLGYGNWIYNLASGDLDGDGREEIVSTEHRWVFSSGPPGLFVYDEQGFLLENFPVIMTNSLNEVRNRGFGEPCLSDVDEDGDLEIVCNIDYIGSDDRAAIRVYDENADIVWETRVPFNYAGPVIAADLNGDGYNELITQAYNAGDGEFTESAIIILDRDGSIIRQMALESGFGPADVKAMHEPDWAIPAVGDLDGDGNLDIVARGETTDYRAKLFAWHTDGTPVSGWPIDLPDDISDEYDPPILADLDGDNAVEVIITHEKWDDSSSYVNLYAFDGDGTDLPGFPTGKKNEWGSGAAYGDNSMVDDLTGDGIPEVTMRGHDGSYYSTNSLYALTTNGLPVAGYNPLVLPQVNYMLVTDHALSDLGTGTRQIILATGTKLVIHDTGSTLSNATLSWPMHRQNPQRTGTCVERPDQEYKASFAGDALNGISNLTVNFTAYPVGFDATNSWYVWDFDGDSTPDLTNFGITTAQQAYASIGSYTVSLTVSNAAGQSFTRTRTNYVNVLNPVQADFSAVIQTADAPIRIQFFDQSQNNPQSWAWDLDGDGHTDSTEQNPEFLYEDAGTFNVTLTVSNDFGAWGASSDSITKSSFIVLSNLVSIQTKYVSKTGKHIFPFKNWDEAATNIQAAIDAVDVIEEYEDGETIIVGDGVYPVGDSPDGAFYTIENTIGFYYRNNLTIRSLNGPDHTSIAGWGHYPSHRGFYVENSDNVTIEGFTISNMYDEGCGGIFYDDYADDPVVRNCRFVDLEGRGVVAPKRASAIYAGAALTTFKGGITVEDCEFIRCVSPIGTIAINTDEGAGVTIDSSLFNDCVATYGTALFVVTDSSPPDSVICRNSAFVDNRAGYGVVYNMSGTDIENCTFKDNEIVYEDGAVLYSANAYAEELKMTNSFGPSVIRNTVMQGTDGPEYVAGALSPMSFSYCVMTSAVAGAGNIATNDAGISGLPGDVHLAMGSPCINAGQNLSWMSSTLTNDFFGGPRIVSGTADIGAHEYSIGSTVDASPLAGTSTLHVAFSAAAESFSGTVTNFVWNYGDGSSVEQGAALTNRTHDYTVEGIYTAILTVQDDAGNSASNGVVITVDDTGPSLADATAPYATTVEVEFDEDVAAASATNLANYSIDTVSISNAVMSGPDSVTLTVSEMTDLSTNILTVSGIADVYGNTMSGVQTQAVVYMDRFGDNRILVDFGNLVNTNFGWNQITSRYKPTDEAGTPVTNAVNVRGGETGIDIRLADDFDVAFYSDQGSAADTNVLYPSTAQRDGINHNNGTPCSIRMSNLSVSNTYDLTFFASWSYFSYDSAVSYYGVGNRLTDDLEAMDNTSNTVSLLEVVPDEDGTIEIDVYNRVLVGIINVLDIKPRLPGIEISTNLAAASLSGRGDLDIAEGDVERVYVRMTFEPTSEMEITAARASGDSNVAVSVGSTLSFTKDNWDQWQEVYIQAAEDDGDFENGTAVIQITHHDLVSRYVDVAEVENDVDVVPDRPQALVPENSGGRFGLSLTAPPANAVTVTVTHLSGDADISVLTPSLVFGSNDWNTVQYVSLRAATDADALNGTAVIQYAAPSIGSTHHITAAEVDAGMTGWSAFHDMDDDVTRNANDHANVSHGMTHGSAISLKDVSDGSDTGADILFRYYDNAGEKANAATARTPNTGNALPFLPADEVFNGYIDAAVVYEVLPTDYEYGVITFTNLEPGVRYDLTLFMNRDQFDYNTVYTLQDVAEWTAASTGGAGDAGDSDTRTFTLNSSNTENGDLVRWSGILPSDGSSFSVHAETENGASKGYLPQAIRLQKQDDSSGHSVAPEVSTNRVVIDEATYETFQVRLAAQPESAATVTVMKVSGDASIIVSEGASLVFDHSDWDLWKTVSLWAGSDADDLDGTAIVHCVAGGVTSIVTAVENDDEDATGPVLLYAAATGSNEVTAVFSEALDSSTAQNSANYSIGGISISGATLSGTDRVLLSTDVLTEGQTYTLTVSNVEDPQGNAILAGSTAVFRYSSSDVFYSNPVESAEGWDLRGMWGFGVPTGEGGTNYLYYGRGYPDPESGFTGTNVFGFNLNGNYPHDDLINDYPATYYLTSEPLDCSDYADVQLLFQRWLNIGSQWEVGQPFATIEVSDDAQNWTIIWENPDTDGAAITDNAWTQMVYDVSSVADGAETFYVRWGINFSGCFYSYSGWNLDDIQLAGRYTGPMTDGVETSPSAVDVPEGGTATFDIRLTGAPVSAVTATVARVSGDADITVQGTSSFIFTTNDWDQWQTVTLAAAQDGDWADGSASIRVSIDGEERALVTATEDDDEDNPAYALPFSEPFENSGDQAVTAGSLGGQNGWTVSGAGSALVQTSTVHGGSQALALTNAAASHSFDDHPTRVNLSFRMQPVFAETAPASIDADATAVFYIGSATNLVAYSNTTPVSVAVSVVSNDWNLFELEVDYVSKVWKLDLNGTNVLSGFGLYYDTNAFSGVVFEEFDAGTSYFDDISIADANSADSDGDGLPDSWEEQYYGNIAPAPTDMASNSTYTVEEAYIAGLDPTDSLARFEITDLTRDANQVVHWSAVSGRVYTIWWTSNLLSGFQIVESNFTGGAFTDTTHSAHGEGFYKIDVRVE